MTLAGDVEDTEWRADEERARIEAEYREVLRNSVAFEKKIRNRWCEKNAWIAELEARVVELERTGNVKGGSQVGRRSRS